MPLSQPLKTIPLDLGEWKGTDQEIPLDELKKIGAIDTLMRGYEREAFGRRSRVGLYIAYFGGVRGTAPHHPDICMPGAGWDILDREMPTLRVAGFDEPLEVHQDVFEHRVDQRKRLVVWWEYIHGENVGSRLLQRIKWALPGFLGGKIGSVLQVQVSVEFSDDAASQKDVVEHFVAALGPRLHQVLPKKKAAPAEEPAGR